jgi:hypothetical protein
VESGVSVLTNRHNPKLSSDAWLIAEGIADNVLVVTKLATYEVAAT